MNHLFIINPIAGNGKGLKLIDTIKSYFKDKTDKYIIEITKKPGHACQLAKEYASKENYRIYSIGGDGTLNEVINGTINTESSVAAIPSGSGNDFIKSICEYNDLNELFVKMIEGTEKKVDCAKVDGKYYINISSLGFDGEVTYNANKLKKYKFFPKKLSYLIAVFKTLIKFDMHNLNIAIDGKKISKQCLFLVVANGRYYGGGMEPAPHADISDGELDICIVEKMGRLKILSLFPLFMSGKHEGVNGIIFYKGKNIQVDADKEFILNIDGDVKKVKSVEFNVQPKCINIVVPRK